MIKINQIDSSSTLLDDYSTSIKTILSNKTSPALGGIFSAANNRLADRLQDYTSAETVLTSSGTASLLIAIEYAISAAGNRPVAFCVSEFLYFSIVSVMQHHVSQGASLQILAADENELDVDSATYIDGHFHIFVLTSHHNSNVDITRATKNVPSEDRYVIEDRCLVFGTMPLHEVDVACYSFSNNKMIITGEGGCVSSNDRNFIEWARWRTFSSIEPTNDNFMFMYMGMYKVSPHSSPFKCSMSSLVSTFINSTLDLFDKILEKRRHNYSILLDRLGGNNVPTAPLFYTYRFPRKLSKKELRQFQIFCARAEVQTHLGVLPYSFFINNNLHKSIISIPCHPMLTDGDMIYIADVVQEAANDIR